MTYLDNFCGLSSNSADVNYWSDKALLAAYRASLFFARETERKRSSALVREQARDASGGVRHLLLELADKIEYGGQEQFIASRESPP
jgi:hypothetical protein